MCPQYTVPPQWGYLTLKLQNSTWYKCLNLSLTGSRTYVCTYIRMYTCMYIHTFVQKDARTHVRTYGKPKNYMPLGIIRCRGNVPMYARMENRKTICPPPTRHHPMRGHKKVRNKVFESEDMKGMCRYFQ